MPIRARGTRATHHRPLRAFALVAGAAAAAVLGPLVTGPAQAAHALPRTGFELTAGARWTTAAEERALLGAVDRTPGAAVTRIGTTAQGRALRLVRLGDPRAPHTVLLVCGQHGDEPSGREACLTAVRDLALPRDPAARAFLARTRLLVVPTANPDGRAAGSRLTAEGADVNRDHIALRTAEARAVAAVLRDHLPDIVVDLHEYEGSPPSAEPEVLDLWPRNPNTRPEVRRASLLLSARVRAAAGEAGASTGTFGLRAGPAAGGDADRAAGGGQERMLRNAAGIKNAVALLVEVRAGPRGPWDDPVRERRRRVDNQRAALRGVFAFSAADRDRVEAATAAARRPGPGPLFLGGADEDPPAPGRTLADPPCAYRLDAAAYAGVRGELALHGVAVVPDGDGALVPLDQPLRGLVPLLLDARASFHLVPGRPLAAC
ncbi:M14 family zinc carboxypeptidase [Streptomyces sp. NPDC047999]|uniref:M14 family zinc carboxypeptidase n=1 Tax=Streptomyces sp. NPDC047999 TaxID=3365497 RepID=UPI00371CE318